MKLNIEDDCLLINGLRQNDKKCFELLYLRYCGRLYNFIFKISGGDTYLSEEIVQKTFIKIWETRENIDAEGSFSAFIYTIGRNMLLNALRLRVQESLYNKYLLENETGKNEDLEKELEYKLLETKLNSIIDELPPARRNVYILSKIKNLPNKEIAAKMNISENTVESQLSKATKYLRMKLSTYKEVMLIGYAFYVFVN
ncbi:MAG: RNA polymerase sigma-70 factor [Paludibacter sp.]|nr:RNA polymerase sigma-70 factor [Paludibacter sp.]